MTFKKINEYQLDNGTKFRAFEGSEMIIDEIWSHKCYEKSIGLNSDYDVIDLGANQGFFGVYAASFGCRVLCYEPSKANYAVLRFNVKNSLYPKNIRCHQMAVYDAEGKVQLFIPETVHLVSSGIVTIEHSMYESIAKKSDNICKTESVGTTTLDKILSDNIEFKNVFLKIDCEGAELGILNGLSYENAKRIRVISMETHAAYSERDICARLEYLGFYIVDFEQLAGLYEIGFICAAREKNLRTPERIVGKLEAPEYCIEKETVSIRLVEGFVVNNLNRSVDILYWSINGKTLDTREALIEVALSKGINDVEVGLIAGVHQCSIKKRVIVFGADYFSRPVDMSLIEQDSRVSFEAVDKLTLSVRNFALPRHWEVKNLIIEFDHASNDALEIECLAPYEYTIIGDRRIVVHDPLPYLDILFKVGFGCKGEMGATFHLR